MKKRLFLMAALLIIWPMLIMCQSKVQPKPFTFEGLWASNFDRSNTTKESAFLSVQKYDEIKYVVISYSSKDPSLNFIAGGSLSSDGVLHIRTEDRKKWAITRGDFFDGRDYISMSPETNIILDEVASYGRIQVKLKTWPF